MAFGCGLSYLYVDTLAAFETYQYLNSIPDQMVLCLPQRCRLRMDSLDQHVEANNEIWGASEFGVLCIDFLLLDSLAALFTPCRFLKACVPLQILVSVL